LVSLLLVCVGLIAWRLWPVSDESLFQKGAALMASDDPDDWHRAWDEYLEPLKDREPYRERVAEFRTQIDEQDARRQKPREARNAVPSGEAQWFYQRGLRLRLQGDEDGAKREWENVVKAFGEVPAERAWVDLARKELAGGGRPVKVGEGRWESVREALKKAR